MTDLVVQIHAFLRWPILLAAALGLAVTVFGMRRPASRGESVLSLVFIGLMDLMVILGAVIWVTKPDVSVAHAVIMLIAVGIAHGLRVAIKKSTDDAGGALRVLVFLLPLGFVIAGLFVLGGW